MLCMQYCGNKIFIRCRCLKPGLKIRILNRYPFFFFFFSLVFKTIAISSVKAHKQLILNRTVRTSFQFMVVLFTLCLKYKPFYDRHCINIHRQWKSVFMNFSSKTGLCISEIPHSTTCSLEGCGIRCF